MVLVLKDEVRTARKFYDCDASEMWRSYGHPRDAVTADERLVLEGDADLAFVFHGLEDRALVTDLLDDLLHVEFGNVIDESMVVGVVLAGRRRGGDIPAKLGSRLFSMCFARVIPFPRIFDNPILAGQTPFVTTAVSACGRWDDGPKGCGQPPPGSIVRYP